MLFLGVTAGGTLGYMLIEGWSAWDAFYMTIISVTTVGYREVHAMSWAGEAWTALVLVSGVSTLFYTGTLVVSLVVEGGLHRKLDSRRFNRMLDDLTQHFIICGYGRIGSVIADEFRRQRVPFVVIDRNPERVHDVIMAGGLAVEADASREEVLKRVGIDRARGLIAAVGTDAENVYTVLTARGLQPGLFIVARVENEDAEAKVRRAGADRVISPYHLGGIQMAATALRPAVVDFMRLATSSERLDLAAEQVERRRRCPVCQQDHQGRQPAPGLRRHRGRDQPSGGPHGIQSGPGSQDPRGRSAGGSRPPRPAEGARLGSRQARGRADALPVVLRAFVSSWRTSS